MDKKTINITLPSGLVGFLFVALKCTGMIDWPWLWVLCPFWLPWAVLLSIIAIPTAIIALAGAAFGIATFVSWLNNYLRRKFL